MIFKTVYGSVLFTSLLAFSLPALGQEQAGEDAPPVVEIYTADDAAAVLDARIIALKTVLTLSPEQEQNWAPVEAAIREISADAAARKLGWMDAPQPKDIVEILDRTADAEITRGEEVKKLTAAMAPLVEDLTFEQQMRIPAFLGMSEGEGGLPQPLAELWLFENEQ